MNWPRVFKALLKQLDADRPLIIDPPRELLGRLPEAAPCISLDYAVWRHLGEQRIPFGLELPETTDPEALVLFQPRARERLVWWLQRLAARFPERPLWLAGAHREGGRGIGKQVDETLGQTARHVTSLGRASLWHCRLPAQPPSFPDPWRCWRHGELEIHALPGVFGDRGVDAGTALLLDTIGTLAPRGRVLDFGCGTGIVSAVVGRARPDVQLTLADSDAPALAAAARTLAANGLDGDIRPVDGWHDLSGSFDWILSNPPFHVGASADLQVARALIDDAPRHLAVGGRLVLVANRHLPLEKRLERTFGSLVKLADNTHFKILSACRR